MKIKIVADSSCDLLTMPRVGFASVPLTISTDEKTYLDDEMLDIEEMVSDLSTYKGRSYTACPSIERWMDSFADADEIYVVTMTSALSGTYNAAMVAREQYLEQHPETKIEVFDTLSTGPEMHLLIDQIASLIAAGEAFETICEKAKEYQKRTRLFFSLESLHNLVQNGRVSKVVASVAGMLGIRILGTASEHGTLETVAKCRGNHKVVSSLLAQLEHCGYAGGKVYLAHSQNQELAEEIKAALEKKYGEVTIGIYETRGLCSYYAEKGGILIGVECGR